jgi:hypothetical protein
MEKEKLEIFFQKDQLKNIFNKSIFNNNKIPREQGSIELFTVKWKFIVIDSILIFKQL